MCLANCLLFVFSENDPMVPGNDKPVPPSILKKPTSKRERAPMIKQTVSNLKFDLGFAFSSNNLFFKICLILFSTSYVLTFHRGKA